MTATRRTPATTPSSVTPASVHQSIRRHPKTNRAIPSSTSSHGPSHRANAWYAMSTPARTCSPPISVSPGGTTKSMATKCIRSNSTTPQRSSATSPSCAIRKVPLLADSGVRRNSSSRPEAANSTRSSKPLSSPTSMATAGFFARSSATTAKAIGSIRTASPSRSTTQTASRKPFISTIFISKKACSAPTATSRRMPTATEKSTPSPARPSFGYSPHSLGTPPFRISRWQSLPALDDRSRKGMGNRSDPGHGHARQSALQLEVHAGQAHHQSRYPRRKRRRRRCHPRARQLLHDLLLLSHLLDSNLLRLPPPNDRKRSQADAPQRGPHHAQLHQLQFSSPARRHFHAWRGRHGNRPPHRARALLLRHPRQLAKCKPRMALLHAADQLRSWIFRPGLQHFRPPYRACPRNQAMHRLPRLRAKR